MSIVTPKYKYNSLIDIDSETLDYLNFVIPGGNLYATSIDDVNSIIVNYLLDNQDVLLYSNGIS